MSHSKLKLGWIGCGRMGSALAARLLRAGHDVAVWNRTRAKAEALAPLGATVVDAPAELADRDVVFVVVSASDDFREVTLGPSGVLAVEGRAPSILVDHSTVSEAVSAEVRAGAAAVGTRLLAAPVSGNAKIVAAGVATFAVSGPRDAYDEVRPLLDELGRGSWYVGEGERARIVKIAHNLMLGAIAQSLVETTLLLQKAGVERADYLAFLNDSVVGSIFSRYKTPALVGLDWTPTFTLPLLCKDLELGLEAARALGTELPLTETARELVRAGIAAGRVEDDFAVLLELQARAAGLELEPETATVSDGIAELARVPPAR
jgi:3-hydroxyisobutyrate dehydrogenase-like beta-hydroxyacid dehydrogenase